MAIKEELEGLVVDTEGAARNRENLEHMRLGEAVQMISQEKQNKIIEAYKRGDIVKKISLDFSVTPGKIYQVLNFYHIPLRSADPNHPASSTEVRSAAGGFPLISKIIIPSLQSVQSVEEPVKINTPVTKSPGQILYEKKGLKTPWRLAGKGGRERYEQKAAGNYKRKSYECHDWEKDKPKVIEDYHNMIVTDFLKKWGLNSRRWAELKHKWGVTDKRPILSNETSEKIPDDRYNEILLRLGARLDAIDAKLAKLETVQTCPLVSIIKALNKD